MYTRLEIERLGGKREFYSKVNFVNYALQIPHANSRLLPKDIFKEPKPFFCNLRIKFDVANPGSWGGGNLV